MGSFPHCPAADEGFVWAAPRGCWHEGIGFRLWIILQRVCEVSFNFHRNTDGLPSAVGILPRYALARELGCCNKETLVPSNKYCWD